MSAARAPGDGAARPGWTPAGRRCPGPGQPVHDGDRQAQVVGRQGAGVPTDDQHAEHLTAGGEPHALNRVDRQTPGSSPAARLMRSPPAPRTAARPPARTRWTKPPGRSASRNPASIRRAPGSGWATATSPSTWAAGPTTASPHGPPSCTASTSTTACSRFVVAQRLVHGAEDRGEDPLVPGEGIGRASSAGPRGRSLPAGSASRGGRVHGRSSSRGVRFVAQSRHFANPA